MSRRSYRYNAPGILVMAILVSLGIGTVLAGIWWVSGP